MDYFKRCLELSIEAKNNDEVPVGAVIVKNNKIIGEGYNLREKLHKVTAHAEIEAIDKASQFLKSWKLYDCDLYVTLKPCEMCEKIIKQSRIRNVFYLIDRLDYKKEYNKTIFYKKEKENEQLSTEYLSIISSYFSDKREK